MAYVLSNHPFPSYPSELFDKPLAGEARAICRIQLDGHLTDCREISSTGSPAFAASLMEWLSLPGLLAHPLRLNGTAVAGTHEFRVHFAFSGGR
jgi:hypothetical protein